MKKLLYIGNKLSATGLSVTSIETLGSLLEQEGHVVQYASDYKNSVFRLLDMAYHTLRYGPSSDFVLIDVYSTLNFWYAVVVSQLCRLLRIPYIAKLHGGDLPKRLNRSPFWSDLVFKHAYTNIAPSGYLLESFQKKYAANLRYIPNTIELENYDFQLRSSLAPQLLWVRAWDSIYHPEMAMQVAALLQDNYSNVTLCMVGPYKDLTREAVQAMSANYPFPIRITGGLTKEEWIALSKDYSIFINTTTIDNTPVSVMEAMALGLPVVSTNVGGLPYLLTHASTGLLVPSGDAQAMAAAIERLLSDPVLAQQIALAARKVVEEMDWEVVKVKWREVLS